MDQPESFIQVPPNDPNEGQNRIPTPSELTTIRNILAENRQDMDHLANRLTQAKGEHQKIQTRNEIHLRELEALKSEMNASHRRVQLLQDQCRMIQVENERLQALIHPVRRCPEEILCEIFLWAVQGSTKHRMQTSTAISHVCRRWRMVSLHASRLWTHVDVSASCVLDAIGALLKRTAARSRTKPVEITLRDIQTIRGHPDFLQTKLSEAVDLDQFSSIRQLTFIISHADGAWELSDMGFKYSTGPLGRLILQATHGPENMRQWICQSFTKRFPTLGYLEISKFGDLNFRGSSLPLLRILKLVDACLTSLEALAEFTELEELELNGTSVTVHRAYIKISLPKIKQLRISNQDSDAWTSFTTPQIQTLFFDHRPSTSVMGFISRHPSISSLDIQLTKSTFTIVAASLPGLKILDVQGFLEGLWKWDVIGMDHPPFVRNALVRTRCGSAGSMSHVGMPSIRLLKVVDKTENLKDAPWRQSELLARCSQRLHIGGVYGEEDNEFSMLTITWPVDVQA